MPALPGTGIGLFGGLLHFLTIGKEVRGPLSWALGDLECGGLIYPWSPRDFSCPGSKEMPDVSLFGQEGTCRSLLVTSS